MCKPENAKFYYKWDDKVVDGTKCDSKGDEICVDGVCLPVGCDGKLGSGNNFDISKKFLTVGSLQLIRLCP